MPDNVRTEISIPQEISLKLEMLCAEAERDTGCRVSKNELVVNIVELFFKMTAHTSVAETSQHVSSKQY